MNLPKLGRSVILELGLIVLITILVASILVTMYNDNTTKSKEIAIWPSPPIKSVNYQTRESEKIIIGEVLSRNDISESDEDPYNINIKITSTLKGNHTDTVVVRVERRPRPLDQRYRPDIKVGEHVLLFLFPTSDDPKTFRTGPTETHIWRIDGQQIYNKYSKTVRDYELQSQSPTKMPQEMAEQWGKTYSLNDFINRIQDADN